MHCIKAYYAIQVDRVDKYLHYSALPLTLRDSRQHTIQKTTQTTRLWFMTLASAYLQCMPGHVAYVRQAIEHGV